MRHLLQDEEQHHMGGRHGLQQKQLRQPATQDVQPSLCVLCMDEHRVQGWECCKSCFSAGFLHTVPLLKVLREEGALPRLMDVPLVCEAVVTALHSRTVASQLCSCAHAVDATYDPQAFDDCFDDDSDDEDDFLNTSTASSASYASSCLSSPSSSLSSSPVHQSPLQHSECCKQWEDEESTHGAQKKTRLSADADDEIDDGIDECTAYQGPSSHSSPTFLPISAPSPSSVSRRCARCFLVHWYSRMPDMAFQLIAPSLPKQ